jgi:hypothetical protein
MKWKYITNVNIANVNENLICFLDVNDQDAQIIINLDTGEDNEWGSVLPEIDSDIFVYQNGTEGKVLRANGKSSSLSSYVIWHASYDIPNHPYDLYRYWLHNDIYKKVSINGNVSFMSSNQSKFHGFCYFNDIELENLWIFDYGYFLESKGHRLCLDETENYNEQFSEIDADYIYIKALGSTYYAKAIKIIYDERRLTLYNSFPPYGDIGDSIGVNIVEMPVDTIVTDLGTWNFSEFEKMKIDNDLYLEGEFSNYVGIYATGDIYLTSDIKLANTPTGEYADGYSENMNYVGGENETDFVQLRTDKSIFIKYKNIDYFNPDTNGNYPVKTPNCNSINIYADLICDNPDNFFTFEYQHPHPSTPPVEIDGITYYPDLHLNQFPPENNNWPSSDYYVIGTEEKPDYPFYNPVWPEVDPEFSRGTINLYGSLISNNPGYIRLSGSDNFYHDDNGTWDLDNFKFAYLNYENNNLTEELIDLPFDVTRIFGYTEYDDLRILLVEYLDESTSILNNCFVLLEDDNVLYAETEEVNLCEFVELFVHDNKLFCNYKSLTEENVTYTLKSFTLSDFSYIETIYESNFIKLFRNNSNLYSLKYVNSSFISSCYTDGYFEDTHTFLYDISFPNIRDLKFSNYDENKFCFIIYYEDDSNQFNQIAYQVDTENYLVANEQIPQHNSNSMTIFPNPITNNRSNVNIKFQIKEKTQADVSIYNVKGQFVKNIFDGNVDSGEKLINWDQKNQNEKQVADGVYFARAKLGNDVLTEKVLIMK